MIELRRFTTALTLITLTAACSPESLLDEGESPGGKRATGSTAEGSSQLESSMLNVGDANLLEAEDEVSLTCGDGILDENEACDDGGISGEGCEDDCRRITSGFICATPGSACARFAVCGDGVVNFPEQCDDNNLDNEDGCNEFCKLEAGFKCDEAGACTETQCGDGVVEGTEMCEPGDSGCTPRCTFAPDCSAGGACVSDCGDGIILGEDEECDDGNLLNGDGCDANCQQEEGYACEEVVPECEKDEAGSCILRVPATFRDFDNTHPSFSNQLACDAKKVVTGLVKGSLVNGVPAATGSRFCTAQVAEWYTDGPKSTTFESEVVLYDNGSGLYTNHWGANGEKWVARIRNNWKCGKSPWRCGPYLGSPFFFPVDGIEGARTKGGFAQAGYSGAYGSDGTTIYENNLLNYTKQAHNFKFSSEIAYWFAYEESTNARLAFSGDDDVWVFVNGKLALDLGGTHAIASKAFTVKGDDPKYGMEPGNVYEIKVFHAERYGQGSTFKLTLSGFDSPRSQCVSQCGDGIVAAGEECDDGVNDGGYNECGPGCRLTDGYCGDGFKGEDEACDESVEGEDPRCSGCRLLEVIR